ncbi:MAG: hypothetical protein J4215_02030 [Candidatus Diapherotrites archaeon]|uniref:DNA-directed RNA polymerase subunit F n=1 Tax=Candidatus Iainarchaeum sp. TaxID=3101447 RepID=A0A8T4L1X6_9ARCH|nr:hypothetical protein [Candidatus Diapherotrites archaeon]
MLVEKIVSKKPIPLAEVKEIIKERLKDKDAEPTYEQDMTIKYVNQYARITRSKADKLHKELMGIEGMDDTLAVKIIDILPVKTQTLEVLIQKKYPLTDAQKTQILDLCKQHVE